jgi:hypothetical protein
MFVKKRDYRLAIDAHLHSINEHIEYTIEEQKYQKKR